jgi:hypothetical protein
MGSAAILRSDRRFPVTGLARSRFACAQPPGAGRIVRHDIVFCDMRTKRVPSPCTGNARRTDHLVTPTLCGHYWVCSAVPRCVNGKSLIFEEGWVAEWFKAPVLKAARAGPGPYWIMLIRPELLGVSRYDYGRAYRIIPFRPLQSGANLGANFRAAEALVRGVAERGPRRRRSPAIAFAASRSN